MKYDNQFINAETNKTNESNNSFYEFADKLNPKNPNESTALPNLSIYYIWKNIKSEYNNNKSEISASTWKLFYYSFFPNCRVKGGEGGGARGAIE